MKMKRNHKPIDDLKAKLYYNLPDSSGRAIYDIYSNFFEQFGKLHTLLNVPSAIHPVRARNPHKERLLLRPHSSLPQPLPNTASHDSIKKLLFYIGDKMMEKGVVT